MEIRGPMQGKQKICCQTYGMDVYRHKIGVSVIHMKLDGKKEGIK